MVRPARSTEANALFTGRAVVGVSLLPWASRAWVFAAVLAAASLLLFVLSAPASAVVTDAVEARNLGYALGWSVILLGWGPGSMVGAVAAGWLTEATFDFIPYLLMSLLCAGTLAALSTRRAERMLEVRRETPPRRSRARRTQASRRQPG